MVLLLQRAITRFYLLFDLAGGFVEKCKAERQITSIHISKEHGISRIDFHVVAGANSYALAQVRDETYLAKTDSPDPRTLRPLSCRQLEQLRENVQELRASGFPHSKLHALREAALLPNEELKHLYVFKRFLRDVNMDKTDLSDVPCGNQLIVCAQKDIVLSFRGLKRTIYVCYVLRTWLMPTVYSKSRKELIYGTSTPRFVLRDCLERTLARRQRLSICGRGSVAATDGRR